MVTPIRGGSQREVDVLVTSSVGGHEVSVGVEACKWSRRADVGWVEKMLGKHADLPTDKLVLYSGSGFTKGARLKAAEHGVTAIDPETPSEDGLEALVLGGLKTLWPKLLSLTPERARVWVRLPNEEVVWFKAPADLSLFFSDGSEFAPDLREASLMKIRSQWEKIVEEIGLGNISESMTSRFELYWHPFSVKVDEVEQRLYARKEDVDPPELHPIEVVRLEGEAIIEVQQVHLTHWKLGDVRLAFGEAEFKGQPSVIVAAVVSTEQAGN